MPLKKKQIEELNKKLLEERSRIIRHLSDLKGEADLEVGGLGGDAADIASSELSLAAIAKLGHREKKLLKLIEHALAKFDDDSYGICELTGEEIPFARLQVSPWAKYTVEAKEELERKERGFRKHAKDSFDYDSDDDDKD